MEEGYGNTGIEVKIISVNSSSDNFEIGSRNLEKKINDWLNQSESEYTKILNIEYKMERVGSPNEHTIVFSALIICKR